MSPREPSFTIGVEEEYLLVDRRSRNLVSEPPAALIEECAALSPAGRVSPEFLQAQIEVGTTVCNSLDEVRHDLAHLRRTVAAVSGKHGLAPVAASTHPFALWREQKHTDKERYRILDRDMQAAARRLMIGGMHVHVGIEDDDLRIDILNQAAYFLPHLLALSVAFLGRNRNRPALLPPVRFRRTAAHGPAGTLRKLRGVQADGRSDGRGGPARGRHEAVVGRAAQRPLSDHRDAHHRRLHAG